MQSLASASKCFVCCDHGDPVKLFFLSIAFCESSEKYFKYNFDMRRIPDTRDSLHPLFPLLLLTHSCFHFFFLVSHGFLFFLPVEIPMLPSYSLIPRQYLHDMDVSPWLENFSWLESFYLNLDILPNYLFNLNCEWPAKLCWCGLVASVSSSCFRTNTPASPGRPTPPTQSCCCPSYR